MSDFLMSVWYVVGWWISLCTLGGLVAFSFIPIAGIFIWTLWRADRSDAAFRFIHFVTNDVGRGSHYALGYTTLVVVCSWGTWALIVLDKLTEWYLTIVIGGFVLGALGGTASRTIAKIKNATDPDPSAGDPIEPAAPAPAAPAFEQTTKITIPAEPAAEAAPPALAPAPKPTRKR